MSENVGQQDNISLNILLCGLEKTFGNAQCLFDEALILAKGGALARSLFLHQITLEECSKVDSLGAWAISSMLGLPVDQKKVLSALRHHDAKNRNNAYMLNLSEAERDARSRSDWEAARKEFRQIQDYFHKSSNLAKNASLYVDLEGSSFMAPSERIDAGMLEEFRNRNAQFLEQSNYSLTMFKRITGGSDEVKDVLSQFVKQIKDFGERKPDDMMSELDALLSSFMEAVIRNLAEGK